MATETTVDAAASTLQAPAQSHEPEPAWLAGRLTRERNATTRALLTEIGVDASGDTAAALGAHKTRVAELAALAGQVDTLRATAESAQKLLAQQASDALAALPDATKAAVTELAGNDPARQLAVMRTLTTHGLYRSAQPAQTTAGQAPPPHTPAAVPLPALPPPAVPAAPNHLATYEAMQRDNPMLAASYYLANQTEIAAARRSR